MRSPVRFIDCHVTRPIVDIYEALQAERSVKFLRYDPQTSHNTLL